MDLLLSSKKKMIPQKMVAVEDGVWPRLLVLVLVPFLCWLVDESCYKMKTTLKKNSVYLCFPMRSGVIQVIFVVYNLS